MPTYEYYCNQCEQDFSLRRSVGERDEPARCPSCGEKTESRELNQFAVGSSDESGPSPCETGSCPF